MSIRTPFYIFDKEKFCALIRDYSACGKIFYPIKANDDLLIISSINENNCGFEVDSIEHINLLINAGISSEKLLYSFPIRETVDIKTALDLGVNLFVIDSFEEYDRIITLSSKARFVVRINIVSIISNELLPEQDKWGLCISDAVALISKIRKENYCLEGISFYITSEIQEKRAFESVINALKNNFRNTDINFINIGGGISLKKLQELSSLLESAKTEVGAKNIVIEPGRHLLNPCIDMEVSVTSVRKINTNRLIFINAGIYSGLMDAVVKNKKYQIVDELQQSSSILEQTFVCGSSSDISDTLGEYQLRTDLAVGDTLLIKECGAYSSVMQTHFYGKKHVDMILKGVNDDSYGF